MAGRTCEVEVRGKGQRKATSREEVDTRGLAVRRARNDTLKTTNAHNERSNSSWIASTRAKERTR